MFSFNINIPSLHVITTMTEDHGLVFNLYVNEEYEGTYPSNSDLEYRIGLIIKSSINKEIKEKLNK